VPALRLAIRVNGLDGLALTKLDVLGTRPRIEVCVGYRVDGREVDELPADEFDLARAEPRFVGFDGWDPHLGGARTIDDLPAAARAYVRAIEELTGVPFYLVSVGAERVETIDLRDPFAP
jgi:adenylosuccinate synthase